MLPKVCKFSRKASMLRSAKPVFERDDIYAYQHFRATIVRLGRPTLDRLVVLVATT